MKQLFSGKNKARFEDWIYKNHELNNPMWYFNGLPFEMQSGVITAYYDSLGEYITADSSIGFDIWHWWINGEQFTFKSEKTRPEALKQAFLKANELENSK